MTLMAHGCDESELVSVARERETGCKGEREGGKKERERKKEKKERKKKREGDITRGGVHEWVA